MPCVATSTAAHLAGYPAGTSGSILTTVDGRPVPRTNWSDHYRKVCAEVGLTGRTRTVGVMGSDAMIGVSAAIRDETALSAGDSIDVELVHDDTPRAVDVSPDFADAMAGVPGTREFFDGLANSLQRFHIDNVNEAKAPDTRQRRIDKAVSLFADGKKR